MALYGVNPMLPGGAGGLPEELERRRSMQAGGLQAQQAAMGGLGQVYPGTGGGGAVAPPPGGAERGPSRVQALLGQRRAEAEGLQGQQAGVQMGQRLLQILDPRLPKPARQFLFRELSREVGIDPRGQRSKELGQMITSLDPEVLEGVRRNIARQVQENPAQVPNLVRGVFTGQVPINNLIGSMTGAPGGAADVAGPGPGPGAIGPSGAGGPPPLGPSQAPPPGPVGGIPGGALGAGGIVQAALGAAGDRTRQQPGTTGTTIPPRRDEGPTTIPPTSPPTANIPPNIRETQVSPILREIAPELATMLGLDPTERYRNIDVIRGGWRNIPTSYEDQQKMVEQFRGLRDGVVNSNVMGNQLVDIFRGRPEALNINVGRLPYLGDVQLPNAASAFVQARDWASGMARLFGAEGFTPATDEGRGRIMESARTMADRIVNNNISLQETANANAMIQSLLINMAFAMAASKGQTGRFLSDRDVELQLQELGRTNSPEQFERVVSSVMSRIYDQYRVRVRSATGGDVSLLPALTPEAAGVLVNGRVTPGNFLSEIEGAGFIRPGRETERGSELGPEGAFDVPRTARAPPGELTGAAAFARPELNLPTPERPRREVQIPEEGVPFRRIERVPGIATVQEEEGTLRARTAEDRAIRLEAATADRRRLEIAESGERRAARGEVRTEEELRRKRIQDAFQAVTQALRGTSTSVNIPSAAAGGEQDAAAFRIAPAPQRQAPRPVEASRFRREGQ